MSDGADITMMQLHRKLLFCCTENLYERLLSQYDHVASKKITEGS